MILFDELLTLRAIEEEDALLLKSMINDPEIENSVVGYSFPVSLFQQKKWISSLSDDKNIRYIIDVNGEALGTLIISSLDFKNRTANLNIKLIKEARGKGYANRALKLAIEYSFNQLNLNCLTANVIEQNESSKTLWEKLGFSLDGVLRSRVFKNGKYHNLLAYSLLKDEYDK